MSFKQISLVKPLFAAAVLAFTGSGVAHADDSSMSMWTGDSYAYFNNLDNNPGKFNTARAVQGVTANPIAKSPRRDQDAGERRILLAGRPTGTLQSPFSDDKGA